MDHQHATYILIGIVIGVLLGAIIGFFSPEAALSMAWIGEFFLNALKMLIVPLIFAAVVSGVASLGDVRKLGRMGGFTVGYYLLTTSMAVLLGLFMVNLIKPGVGVERTTSAEIEAVSDRAEVAEAGQEGADDVTDILLSLVSPNLIGSASQNDLLPIILFAIMLACALSVLGDKGKTPLAFFSGMNEAMMRLVIWLMYLAPVGIFGLVAGRLGLSQMEGGFLAEVSRVGWHVVTVMSGLAVHFVILYAILRFFSGRGWQYLVDTLRALLTAFGTSSSSATLPLTMECVEEAGINKKASRFVLPLGSTVNMNGTALYEACAAMFIAQVYAIDLSFTQQGIIFVTATLAAIGAAGIPEAGLVTMLVVLNAVGLPLEGIALLLTVDWFLDRCRTSVNVWGDVVGAAVVSRYAAKQHIT